MDNIKQVKLYNWDITLRGFKYLNASTITSIILKATADVSAIQKITPFKDFLLE